MENPLCPDSFIQCLHQKILEKGSEKSPVTKRVQSEPGQLAPLPPFLLSLHQPPGPKEMQTDTPNPTADWH